MMTIHKKCWSTLLMLASTSLLSAAQAADKLFAAPATNDSTHVAGAGSAGHVTLALALVLVCVFAAAWVLKQTRKLQGGGNAVDIKIISQLSLGAKERAVLLQVRDVQLLVGVTAGQVSTLHVFAVSPDSKTDHKTDQVIDSSNAAPLNKPSFQTILKRSLGMS